VAGILILARYKTLLIIHYHMGGKQIPKRGVAFENHSSLTQFSLWVLRRHINTQFFNLFISNSGHATSGDEKISATVFGVDKTQYTMTDAAYNGLVLGVKRITDF
jgi:hypothetical protein